ncbi:OmpA family protein [Oceaniglobus trochenteri]|uniref:OmpA family protein n=1 Tax=Oceaniglobus trochenteri TaxID=2763260 RepID=UPI001CFFB2FE|nr:OmpA family protein [Oceaniglobus trochenteri]
MTPRILPLLALGLWPAMAPALTLDFPAPVTLTADQLSRADSLRLPAGPFDGTSVKMRATEGQVTRQAWRLASGRMTTGQILDPLRRQLESEGFNILYECRDTVCGGFDFRFAADVMGEPAMHVDLGNYRYLLAEDGDGVTVALMVSRSPNSGFVQLTRVGDDDRMPDVVVTSTKSASFSSALAPGTLLGGLVETGRAPLDDLLFQTGSSNLEQGEFPSLRALARYLETHPEQRVTLVGHTDTEGGLDGNIALSRRRAEAVRDVLVESFGVDRAQISAEGVGYLAPRASNETADGRLANRRVEVVLNN